MVVLYHYTNKESADAIDKSKLILKSVQRKVGDDAAFGEGTYFTSLPPQKDKLELVRNN